MRSIGFCFNCLQNASLSSSVSKPRAKYLSAAQIPHSVVSDASLVTIEALMAYSLRHILEELLPSPRRGVCIVCVCVCDVTELLRATCKKTNYS